MENRSFYNEILTEHNVRPEFKHDLPDADIVLEGVNPSCGDDIFLKLKTDGDTITDGAFVGDGCAISQASADIMLGMIVGKKKEEALQMGKIFMKMIKGDASEEEIDSLEEASALRDIAHMPARVKCAVLGWRTLKEALLGEDADDDDDEDGDSEPDYESLWRPVRNGLQSIKVPALSFAHGVKDKETENLLKQVEQLYQEGLLELLVPEGQTVSKKTVETSLLPSEAESYDEESGSGSMAEHILVNEYCGKFFRQFCTEETASGHALDYEVEYLICGNPNDPDNLSGVVHRLLAVRAGLNLIHILRDKGMRKQARTLATVITGAAAITPLVLVTTFFVMSVWSLGEALMDVKGLLAGKKVKLVKKKDDWTLTIENLISMAKNRNLDAGGGDSGLSYLSWLKILLFVTPMVRQDYRIMDVIELNLAQGKSGFCMRNAVYQVQMSGNVCGKHLFFSPAFVENLTGNRDYSMMMTVKAERRY